MKRRGFSLIEVLVCAAIIALLATVALSTYRGNVLRVRRADAQHALLQLQALQERHYFEHGRYAVSIAELGDPPPPAVSREGWYALQVEPRAGGEGYVVRARPVDGGAQQSDRSCESFAVDDTGMRMATGADDAPVRCWN